MKLTGFAAAALVAAAGSTVFAQGPTGYGAPRTATGATRYTAIGCVSRVGTPPPRNAPANTPQQFIITDTRGEKPTVYRLEGSTNEELTFQVGHTLEVSGTLTPPAAGATGPNATAMTMHIQSIVYVAASCKK